MFLKRALRLANTRSTPEVDIRSAACRACFAALSENREFTRIRGMDVHG